MNDQRNSYTKRLTPENRTAVLSTHDGSVLRPKWQGTDSCSSRNSARGVLSALFHFCLSPPQLGTLVPEATIGRLMGDAQNLRSNAQEEME